jgi:hypothetical protein
MSFSSSSFSSSESDMKEELRRRISRLKMLVKEKNS